MAGLDFNQILEANRQAFTAIAGIRVAIENDEKDLTRLVQSAFEQLGILAVGYAELEPKEKSQIKNAYQGAFTRAQRLADEYRVLRSGLDFSIETQLLLDPSCPAGVYSMIEEVPPEFATNDGLDIGKAETAHALLRYLHQRHILAAFDPKKLEHSYHKGTREGIYDLMIGYGSFHIVDLDSQIDCPAKAAEISEDMVLNAAIKPIFEYYRQCIPTAGSGEVFYIFLKRNRLNAHVSINCHSAEIDIILDGDKSQLIFNYNEYLNANWRARTKYFSKALGLLGFYVESRLPRSPRNCDVSFDQVIAKIEAADEGTVAAATTELMRLITSSTHINCSLGYEYIKKKVSVDDCLKAFLSGQYTNLYQWLKEIDDECRSPDDDDEPNEPCYCSICVDNYPGNTRQEKVVYAEKKYKSDLKAWKLNLRQIKAKIPSQLKAVRDMPPLEEIAKNRRETLGIKLDATD